MVIPTFQIFGKNNPEVEYKIQPNLNLRKWSDLSLQEKEIAFQQLKNKGWIGSYSKEILNTIETLNHDFLRVCPGKKLHAIQPVTGFNSYESNEYDLKEAASQDFYEIFVNGSSDEIVFRMFSEFLKNYIDTYYYDQAVNEEAQDKKLEYVQKSFKNFDILSNCLNHIFAQFCINIVVTRNGLIPRQDEKILKSIYSPVLTFLSAENKWSDVNRDLTEAFNEFTKSNETSFSTCITKAISSLQCFLQIVVTGKQGKGSIGDLVIRGQKEKILPDDNFTKEIFKSIESHLMQVRSKHGDAHIKKEYANEKTAILVLNLIMVFMQHCIEK